MVLCFLIEIAALLIAVVITVNPFLLREIGHDGHIACTKQKMNQENTVR